MYNFMKLLRKFETAINVTTLRLVVLVITDSQTGRGQKKFGTH